MYLHKLAASSANYVASRGGVRPQFREGEAAGAEPPPHRKVSELTFLLHC